MSFSDSGSSSNGGDYKDFRQITRERLLCEMLRPERNGSSKLTWKVLVMDKFTVKIMSSACKMSEITQEGISLVEVITKHRQPMTSMEAIYFIQPTQENVTTFLSDMTGKSPLYKRAFVFFSSPVSRSLVNLIKKDMRAMKRIGGLKEMNLEYISMDIQGFITNNENALEELFSDEENHQNADDCLNVVAKRIATVLASLKEYPLVRYRSAKALDATTMTTYRELIPTKLAASVWNILARYKQTIEDFPQTETCELLILDRSIDQIAPLIHEWTYDAMCHDLLNMEGNKYTHEVPSKTGDKLEKKEVLLDEQDPIWVELRDVHIADASERLHEKMTNFVSKNKAAQLKHSSKDFGDLSSKDLQKMVHALPQYSEQMDKLSLHVEIARTINKTIMEQGLRDLGQLEQDLVFGDAGRKDVIKFLSTNHIINHESKLRLMMIVAGIYPKKFEGEKGRKMIELAKLTGDDIIAVNNMRLLGPVQTESKKSTTGSFPLKFDVLKKKRAARIDRVGETQTWQLSRFYPIVEELVEKLSKGHLPKQEFPCMNEPKPTFYSGSQSPSSSPVLPHSRRTPTWARRHLSDDGYFSDSVLGRASSGLKRKGQRIFVFIVGGATRSELRVCHKLTEKLDREVILGSSSFLDPQTFLTKMKRLNEEEEISLDDIII
ncbi:PREDICTED: protein transport Sec1b-like isoform X1 [Camelina sativa]|uniref:Protein transport Sec1b-like isoform X1 n=1 Tax=Camelina sativa TaxID=90675 RepID=A0ABM1QS02_CAMSA|nr:PREDICTED: protein transport Sec1b-like isoform X1 [Camelina sativa]